MPTTARPPLFPAPAAEGAPACRAEVLAEAEARCGRAGVRWAVATGRALLADITRDLADRRELSGCDDVRLTSDDHAFLELVALWCALRLSGVRRPPDALAHDVEAAVRTHVERGFDLDGPLTLIRMAHAGITRDLMGRCDPPEGPAHRVAALRELSDGLFDAVEVLCGLVSAGFSRERQRWRGGLAGQRRELVRRVLRGEHVPEDRATGRLGYDVTQQHLAVLVRSETERRGADLERAALRLLGRAGCTARLLVPAGAAELWAWGAQPDAGAVLAGTPLPDGVRAATGLPAPGLAGMRASHLQAVTAAGIGARAGAAGVHEYRDLELVSLLAAHETAAAAFVARELGPLAEDSPTARALRATLKSYLDSDRSPAAAAKNLHVAKNTVLYRVRKAERLRGSPLGENRLRLHAALHLAEVLLAGGERTSGATATARTQTA
ncbi:helix-turn-helix domain-containing protein [Actinosynnema pretiosum subsp. pretiosum]|uniref:Helix-turn-helix domain-containing protein n=2 Tax=Actinosynnema TaxID=40566 RepID=A0AA45L7D4_9PSEU|nr:PucR family transcriptional regulator [Actinosynnema mirum]ACU38290.1 putative transcriptional regulator, PucR family [Actinosynnema mirum DSM 43827]AXX31812.1 hypothetical protein APASM_4447 [Actinosynnema pretiosum subsp. pretiosum]QUF04198.1 helix-turn-helix domain-containing protein [Actinosynnema pretiosum subsp. pretiosum]